MVLFSFLMRPVVSQSTFENRQILLGHPLLAQPEAKYGFRAVSILPFHVL
jgi:hypothetical protein